MSIRTIIFCDICNPQGLRAIEFRRAPREDKRNGRRISDGRASYQGSIYEATTLGGWIISEEGEHICSDCKTIHTSSKL
jgi:hypothetical protein